MERCYLAYLLRLWRTGDGESAVWRASLENPHTGEHRAFANLEALFAFLKAETDAPGSRQPSSHPAQDVEAPGR